MSSKQITLTLKSVLKKAVKSLKYAYLYCVVVVAKTDFQVVLENGSIAWVTAHTFA
ncbi:hypothetical protein R50072_12710 [Simiduia litorea]